MYNKLILYKEGGILLLKNETIRELFLAVEISLQLLHSAIDALEEDDDITEDDEATLTAQIKEVIEKVGGMTFGKDTQEIIGKFANSPNLLKLLGVAIITPETLPSEQEIQEAAQLAITGMEEAMSADNKLLPVLVGTNWTSFDAWLDRVIVGISLYQDMINGSLQEKARHNGESPTLRILVNDLGLEDLDKDFRALMKDLDELRKDTGLFLTNSEKLVSYLRAKMAVSKLSRPVS